MAAFAAYVFLAWTLAQPAPPAQPTPAPQATPAPQPASEVAPIRVVVSPIVESQNLQDALAPLAAHLGQQIGRPFTFTVPETYEDAIAITCRHEVDLAYLAPFSYLEARKCLPELEPLVTDVREGIDFYTGLLVVRDQSGIESLEDLRGKRVAFTSRASASGYVLPLAFLADNGIQVATDLGELVFTQHHDVSLQLLIDQQVDVAAVSSTMLRAARKRGMPLDDLVILARTGTVPQDVISSTGSLPPDLVERITEALLSISSHDQSSRALLPTLLRLNGWHRADKADYDRLERSIRDDAR